MAEVYNLTKSVIYFHKANMSHTPDWWEKHYHRIKELNQISKIAEILGIALIQNLQKSHIYPQLS